MSRLWEEYGNDKFRQGERRGERRAEKRMSRNVAAQMLREGEPLEKIVRYSKLSPAQILEIKKKIPAD